MPWNSANTQPAQQTGGGSGGWNSANGSAPAPVAKPQGGAGGFFHDLLHNPVTHAVGQTATDLKNVAVNAPAGIYNVGKLLEQGTAAALTNDQPALNRNAAQITGLGKQTVSQIKTDLQHPLRHPGYTLLDVLPAVNVLGKAAEVGRVAKVEGLGAAAKSVTSKRVPPSRVIEAGGVQARLGNYSQAPAVRLAQQAIDRLRAQFPERAVPGMQTQFERVGKALAKNRAVETKIVSAPFTQLRAAGKGIKWDSPEGVAMRAVAEGTSLDARIAAHAKDLATATTATARRGIQRQIKLAMKARSFVKDTPQGLTITDPKLSALYEKTKAAALLEDQRLVGAGLMDPVKADEAIQKPGRLITGATYEPWSPAKEGIPSQALVRARAYADRIGALVDKQELRQPLDNLMPNYLGGRGDTARVAGLRGAHSAAREEVQRLERLAAGRLKPTGVVGNEGFGAGQFHVGYERRAKPFSINKPVGLGNQNTVGIPTRPGRLRNELTGANFKQGAFRNDVPSLVADNALESERYLATERARQFFLNVAKDTPEGIRPGKAVAIRTDLLGSNPMANEVKDFLDAQRSVRQADEHKFNPLGLLYDDYRQQIFPNVDASDFERYAGHVKWIDKDLLGGLNKPGPLATAMQHESFAKGIKAFDAINNAQKFALLYLKPAYAVPNMVGNGFLNLVQQGWAAPANLTRAARLAHHIGPEDAAVIRDLMGEGIGASLESRSGFTASLNNAAARHVFEPLVDTPFRLASFLYEARRELGLRGAMNQDDWQRIHGLLHNETLRPQLTDTVARANKAIIDYGDLTPVEQAIIRRVVFFYPWIKGSTKYAGHFLADHPMQAGALGQLGQQGKQFSQQGLGPLPSWAEGYFKVGGSATQPLIVNPTSAGILNQPGQIAEAVNQFVSSPNPQAAYQLASFLTPVLAASNTTLSGKDQFTGRAVPTNASTFISQALGFNPSHPLNSPSLPALLLAARLTQDQSQKMFPVTPHQAIAQFLFGGVAPKSANQPKLTGAYYKERKPLRP